MSSRRDLALALDGETFIHVEGFVGNATLFLSTTRALLLLNPVIAGEAPNSLPTIRPESEPRRTRLLAAALRIGSMVDQPTQSQHRKTQDANWGFPLGSKSSGFSTLDLTDPVSTRLRVPTPLVFD
jgi:hypothetical protein